MSSPLISVIVPVYNTQDFLPKCLQSILGQTYKNLEVILVDDGSTDGSPALCEEFACKDSRVKVIHQQNQGVAVAIKNGIEQCTGQYTAFADSDDWMAENMLERLSFHLFENSADMVQCNFVRVYEGDKTQKCFHAQESRIFQGEQIQILAKNMLTDFEGYPYSVGNSRWTKIVRTQLLKKNLGFVKEGVKIGEDFNLIFPVLLDCQKVVLAEDFLYFYLQRENSATKGYLSSLERDYQTVLGAARQAVREKGLEKIFADALQKREYAYKLSLIRNICRSEKTFKQKKSEIKQIHRSSKKIKIRQARFKHRLLQKGLEVLLALRLYGLIVLLVK